MERQSTERRGGGPVNIGGRREVFWDSELLEEWTARFSLEEPQKKEIVLRLDRPWEGKNCGYFHAFRDGDVFRLYYRAAGNNSGNKLIKKGSICLLTSADGIHWERPRLGLKEFDGSRDNNIIISGEELDNFFVFKDENPACLPGERYKAVSQGVKTKELPNGGVWGYVSPDGLEWKPLSAEPLMREGYFDSLNTVHWDGEAGKYRLYYRGFHGDEKTGRFRDIRLALSEDFRHWEEAGILSYMEGPGMPEECEAQAPPEAQLYTNGILPYYRAPHLWVGFPVRYVERSWEPLFEQLPNPAWRKEKMERFKEPRLGTALTDGLFMTSRDGFCFRRWGEAFLKPGPFRVNNWVYGDCYQSWGLLETPGEDPLAPQEISFFAGEDYTSRPVGIRRYTVRLDGFACLCAGGREERVLTKPLIFSGDTLTVNLSTSAAGSMAVEFLSPDGTPIPGFSGEAAYRHFGDAPLLRVLFRRGEGAASDCSPLEGKPVRIRFTLRDAKLYSLRFIRREDA